jgi:hypothetical protein
MTTLYEWSSGWTINRYIVSSRIRTTRETYTNVTLCNLAVPYVSYFSPTKVSITVPCELKFHDVKLGNRPSKLAQTSWVNYVFDTSQGTPIV